MYLGDALGLPGLAATPSRHITAIGLTWPGAVACLTTAAALHGLPVPPDPEAHALVDRRTRSRDGVRLHVRPLLPGDVVAVGRGLVTSRRRTILDCVGLLPDDASESLVAWCVTRQLIDHADIDRAIADAPGRWGNRRLRQASEDARAGTLSAAERRLRSILRRSGLSGYAFDQRITDGTGIIGRADALFAAERLVIEIDGYAYHSVGHFQADRDKQNRLMLAGYTVLRFTWADLARRPDHVADQIARTLAVLRAR